MSNATQRNFGAAQRERDRRVAASLQGDLPIGSLAVTGDPGWDAFFGSLHDKADAAAASGQGFRADLGGIGRWADAGSAPSFVGPAGGLGQVGQESDDQWRARQLTTKAYADAQVKSAIDDMQQSYAQHVLDSVGQPRERASVTTQSVDANGRPTYTIQNAEPDTRTDRERMVQDVPGSMRPGLDQALSPLDLADRRESVDEATKIGPGTLPNYLLSAAQAKGSPLTPQETMDARNEWIAASTTGNPKVQEGLEQKYRDVLAKEFSSRSGGFGIENGKVDQAIHLMQLMEQNKDPKTGAYNIPKAQYAELAMGLASLISPQGRPTDSARQEIETRTAAGDLNSALTYITGTPANGSTQDIFKMLKDSIERQGRTAEKNRAGYFEGMRALAPTDLSPERRDKLEKAQKLNSLDAPAGSAQPSGRAMSTKIGDVVNVGGKRVKVTAIHPDGSFDGDQVK